MCGHGQADEKLFSGSAQPHTRERDTLQHHVIAKQGGPALRSKSAESARPQSNTVAEIPQPQFRAVVSLATQK